MLQQAEYTRKAAGAATAAPGAHNNENTRGATGKERSVENRAIYIVLANTDEKPAPWSAGAVEELCAGYSREIAYREADAYCFGYADGFKAGRAAVEAEFAQRGAVLARQVRHLGLGDWQPYSERRRRELEWAKPRPDDFMGQLSYEEYMGQGRAA